MSEDGFRVRMFDLEKGTSRDVPVTELEKQNKDTLYNFLVGKEDIVGGRVQKYLDKFSLIERKKDLARNCVVILFDGYNDDPREIYRIPEIRAWINRFYANKPHLFYFLSTLDPSYFVVVFLCLMQFSTINQREGIYQFATNPIQKAKKIAEHAVKYSIKVGDSSVEQFNLYNRVLEHLQFDTMEGKGDMFQIHKFERKD